MIEIQDIPANGQVTEPGLYRMTAEQYHGDPCPAPSLSSSAIRTMLDRTPRHAYCAHPRLGGISEESSSPAMTLGTVVHALILGAGRDFVVIDADSFRTKAAQEARDMATASGKTPIIREQYEKAKTMAMTAQSELGRLPLVGDALVSGRPEIVAIWREGDIWCRSMMDLCPTRPDIEGWFTIYDLKTTQMALDPLTIGRHLVSNGYDVQAAFYTRGLESVLGIGARVRFRFLFVESDSPYASIVAQCSGLMASTGEQKALAGISIWQRCMETGEFPGYSSDVQRLDPPTFLENQWRDREAGDPLIADALNNWRDAA